MLINHTQIHDNNWLSCLVKLKVKNTIKDDCSVSLIVRKYDLVPCIITGGLSLYNYVVNQYEGLYALCFLLHGLAIDILSFDH